MTVVTLRANPSQFKPISPDFAAAPFIFSTTLSPSGPIWPSYSDTAPIFEVIVSLLPQ
jgi:hypothetical protein